jgi:hypothetical protein
MTQTNQIVVMTQQDLIILIEEIFIKLRNAGNSGYPSPSEGATTKVFTREDVAIILKCTPNTVTKYIKQKKLHASVFNRQYRINEKELLKFINQKPTKC